MSEFLSEEPQEEKKYEDMPTDDLTKESHYRIIGPSPKIEDPEKKKQPGEIVESVPFGDGHVARGTICRDTDGNLCEVIDYEFVKDTETYQDDKSIRRPKILKNPIFTVKYPDGTQKQAMRGISPVYSGTVPQITESDEYFDRSHLELRDHSFKLGDLVSFGNGIGRLALIVNKEKSEVGIVAPKERGKGGPTFLWMVDAEEVDYVVHDEKGAIKCNPDNTIFKPSL